ncbi:MAG TPA: hypothetical protein VEB21_17925 [Terriglobales bacterium]|nr:hypothetical protein [Terriglobales bacterium]
MLLLVSVRAVPAQPTPQPTRPMLERCRLFCSGVFHPNSKEYQECSSGCDDAESCTQRCRERFPEDKSKHGLCYKACMAKGRQFEPPPTPALPIL